ncbi:MAG: outer membrane receptor for ferrienterochelin and colicins [Rhodothermales bacterium]|jgi:outer membrane receptor for ferrienterochelin and colicins
MVRLWTLLLFFAIASEANGQHALNALVLDGDSGLPLAGVNVLVTGTEVGAATALDGTVSLTGLPSGTWTIAFSFIGFESESLVLDFPLPDPGFVYEIRLEEGHEEMEEIAVSATRTSRTIANQAVRVETIAGEEIDEKISMEPSNISMLLNESPGIVVQQTSAVSGNASIRIQGLDGRYTQILKDGFPLFGGFSGGLSLLQVPPLDLRQVEVIKGPSSTLYGGGAIAGLVNLVSKGPSETPEWSLLANLTSAGGTDLGTLYRARGERMGLTLLATGNLQQAYDPDDDIFSNLPDTRRFTLHPKVFWYPGDATEAWFGVAATVETREGGDLDVLDAGPSPGASFSERNETTRLTTQARLDHRIDAGARLTAKNSVSLFERSIQVPDYRFDGRQLASYTELSALSERANHDVVLGADFRSDAFREDSVTPRDYTYSSVGLFAQDTWDATSRIVIEAGLRGDWHNTFGSFLLPKASVLFRATDRLSARVGAGGGYKAPTVFLEPSEERAFRGVLPLSARVRAETSRGGTVDVNYAAVLFGEVALSVNQAFHFTNLDHALVPTAVGGTLSYENSTEPVRTRAFETNLTLSREPLKLFLGYVYLDAREQGEPMPLTPKHKTYSVLVLEKHGQGRIGLEAYYTGPQDLPQGGTTAGYWVTGVMAEKRFGRVRVFLNFENILDTKQSNYAPVVLGSRTDPRFAPIWAPMDGFVVNGGVKLDLRN